MTRQAFNLALAALAAPFQHLAAFLRCAVLPFLICMASAAVMTLVDVAYPSPAGESSHDLPAFVQLLILLLFGLGLLSLISFSIAWRRSLGLTDEERGVASLLTIDTRTLIFLLARMGWAGSHSKAAKPSRGRTRRILGGLGMLVISCVAVLGGIIAFFTAVIGFAAHGIPVQLLFSAMSACAFTYIWLVASDWQACTAAALGSVESVASQPVSRLRFFILGPLVTLVFFTLSIAMPVLSNFGDARSLSAIGVWMIALFLSIAWFAALETLPFVQRPQQSNAGLLQGGEFT